PDHRYLHSFPTRRSSDLTSPSSISNTYYLLAKYENAKTALEKIRKFKLICSMSIMDDEVVDKAIVSGFKDFEDAMQYFSAVATGCDLMDFKNALIPVMNAESYLQTLSGPNVGL